ncbi:C6 transcription factor [Aspergillus costaricaensis CBS 115574]|uniref:C6 transcription factor n=1 Tax=Aspergillus costaricaensis CBS 115574 TaxID=1448317 RepID=A0ACD1IJY6_9EURO|nr:C6 transcription factor [Aspergillus costaricaensis CBS 115574]RAK90942.1 C6 transcription factor [Aspergillus costaricaensis CBS 115574]
MEIDPRLRAGSDSSPADGTAAGRPYIPPPVSSRHPDHNTGAPSALPRRSDYPEPPSPYSPADQLRSAVSSASGPGYYGSAAHSQSTPSIYRSGPEPGSVPTTSSQLDPVDPNDPYAELRRPRACEACRQLKVRCEPDLSHPNGTCKRCAKAGRNCIVTVPTRKRQKKTDSRVAELERKIDALTASLQASQGHEPHPLPPPAALEPPREEHPGRRWLSSTAHASTNGSIPLRSPSSTAGSKRRHSGEIKETAPVSSRTSSPSDDQSLYNKALKQWRAMGYGLEAQPKDTASEGGGDLIDRGVVSETLAQEAFTKYVDRMATLIPMVVFPPGTTMDEVRQKKPVLFHAIIAAAIGTIQPHLQLSLLDEFYKVVAERVIVKGEKSLDLVQAILVCCNWYTPPDNFEEVKFYQLSNIAVSLAMDLGLNRKAIPKSKPFALVKELISKKSSIVVDLDSAEARRTWLACYFVAVQCAVSLRRVNLVRWMPYMDECVEILEKSPEALPSDKGMIQWAKLAHILEDIAVQFTSDDAPTVSSFSDPKFLYTLRVLERQLDQWRRETPPEHFSPILKQADCIINLFLHENAMHVEFHRDDPKTANDDLASPTSPAHINALSTCLTSIHDAIDTLCSIETKDLVLTPTVALARTSFAIVALIKIYSIVSSPDTRMAQVIDLSSLKTEYYLDKVIRHYTKAGETPGGRTPAKFSVVLSLLRNWFMKRKDQGPVLKEALSLYKCSDEERLQQPPQQDKQNQAQGQTPLHLLSEVAMGDPQSRSTTTPVTTATNNPSPTQTQPTSTNRPIYTPNTTTTTTSTYPDLLTQQSPSSSSDLPVPHSHSHTHTHTTDSTTEPPSSTWVQQYPPPPRQFYPTFSPSYQDVQGFGTDPSNGSNGNGMVVTTPGSGAGAGATGTGSGASAGTSGGGAGGGNPIQGLFVPELGVQMGFDPENLFMLGNMLGDEILNLPFQADGGMGMGMGMGFY